MKEKIITATLSCLLLVFASSVVLAQNGQQQRVQDPTVHDADTYVAEEAGTQQQINAKDGTGVGEGSVQEFGQGMQGSTQNLNRVSERSNNPETGEQVRTMVERHERIQVKTSTAIKNMNKRSGLGKFILGPDYKNAGEVKGVMSELNDDVDALTILRDDAVGQDAEDIQSAIDDLQDEIVVLEDELEDQTTGFSLFGWLGRLISQY